MNSHYSSSNIAELLFLYFSLFVFTCLSLTRIDQYCIGLRDILYKKLLYMYVCMYVKRGKFKRKGKST